MVAETGLMEEYEIIARPVSMAQRSEEGCGEFWMKCHGRETVWGYFDPAFRPMLQSMMECEGQLEPG